MKRLLLRLFKKELIKIYTQTLQHKPADFSQLQLAFVDLEGRKYYRCSRSVSLPMERFSQMNKYLGYMSAGISAKELQMLLDEADTAIMDGLKNGKNAAKVSTIIHQIRERQNMILHTDLMYNFFAVQLIREDEKLEYFDEEIQMQKVEQFKKEVKETGSWFFFHQPELREISNLFSMSEEEWTKYWEISLIKQKSLIESINFYQSTKE